MYVIDILVDRSNLQIQPRIPRPIPLPPLFLALWKIFYWKYNYVLKTGSLCGLKWSYNVNVHGWIIQSKVEFVWQTASSHICIIGGPLTSLAYVYEAIKLNEPSCWKTVSDLGDSSCEILTRPSVEWLQQWHCPQSHTAMHRTWVHSHLDWGHCMHGRY